MSSHGGHCYGAAGDGGLQWLKADAEGMPCSDASVDSYTIAFGIRNVTDIPAALQEAHRVHLPAPPTSACNAVMLHQLRALSFQGDQGSPSLSTPGQSAHVR